MRSFALDLAWPGRDVRESACGSFYQMSSNGCSKFCFAHNSSKNAQIFHEKVPMDSASRVEYNRCPKILEKPNFKSRAMAARGHNSRPPARIASKPQNLKLALSITSRNKFSGLYSFSVWLCSLGRDHFAKKS